MMPLPVVQLQNIHKFYSLGEEKLHVLKGINLTINKGDYAAIMGPSGSGKSTLLNLVGLLDTIDAGQYVLDGADVSSLNDSKLARSRNQQIGFIFQGFNLFRQHTVLGNIEVP